MAASVASFPTKTVTNDVLSTTDYNLSQLRKAFDRAQAGGNDTTDIAIEPHLFHLHSHTFDQTLLPEPEHQEYAIGGGEVGLRLNHSHPVWVSLRNDVHAATEACVPISLCSPRPAILRPPHVSPTPNLKRVIGKLFLPSGSKDRPLVPILRVPQAMWDDGQDFFLSANSWDNQTWIQAALALCPQQKPSRRGKYRDDVERIHLRTGVQITWVPKEDPEDDDDVELRLLVTVHAYLNMDTWSTPQPTIATDLFCFILQSILPDKEDGRSPNAAGGESRRTETSVLNDFYNALAPGPEIPANLSPRQLQPKEMICPLLPFQTRTLVRLLQREHSPMVAGTSLPQTDGQWVAYHFEGFGNYAFCRLTGQLVCLTVDPKGKGQDLDPNKRVQGLPELFPVNDVRGTMLCEEMGLGKTVEAIALLLLHRHPLSSPRPFSPGAVIPYRDSPEVNLRRSVPEDDAIKSWLDREHDSFSEAWSWSEELELQVAEVATTLVVTPQPLLKQWVAEMSKHAPSLRICVYPGWRVLIDQVKARRADRHLMQESQESKRRRQFHQNKSRKQAKLKRGPRHPVKVEEDEESGDEDEEIDEDDFDDTDMESLLSATQRTWLEYVRGHDIVITSYQTLGEDLNVAHSAPKRSRRSNVDYGLEERPRSPLVMVEWWRVIMDEVQLQGDQTQAATMVSLIPRKNSLAMSGTPARTRTKDLHGSLKFLRVPGINNTLWHRLTRPVNSSAFYGLFRPLAVRTTKAQVAAEFELPPQTRYVVPIELSAIEMHYYVDTLERQRQRILASEEGSNLFDIVVFQQCLRHLRQICTHIQVGALQRGGAPEMERGERNQLGRTLMTMEEALAKMRVNHETTNSLQLREHMRNMVRKAQLLVHNDEDKHQHHLSALALHERVREEADKLLGPARARLLEILDGREDSVDDDVAKNASQGEKEKAKQISAARQVVRETLVILHQSWFFEGDIWHVERREQAEVAAYQTAENIRKELLSRPLRLATRSMTSLAEHLEKHAAIESPDELKVTDTALRGGILSNDIVTQSNSLLMILNDNATLVQKWRLSIIKYMQLPLEAEEDEAIQGQDIEKPEEEYYAKALEAQGILEEYMAAYESVIADRKEMLLEQRTVLAQHQGRVTKKRKTKAARDAQLGLENEGELGDADQVKAQLAAERLELVVRRRETDCTRSLKGLVVDLSGITKGGGRAEEVDIAKIAQDKLRVVLKKQTEYVDRLTAELDRFKATFNQRVRYFAFLQHISDTVASPMFDNLDQAITKVDQQIIEGETILARLAVQGRYLNFLGNEGPERNVREECSICFGTSDDVNAVLLSCGHALCVSCFRVYRKTPHIGRRCATCQAPIEERLCTKIRIKKEDEHEALADAGEGPSSQNETDDGDDEDEDEKEKSKEDEESKALVDNLNKLNVLGNDELRSIFDVEILGEFGSKINFLIQHLRLKLLTQPTLRHVVFSNWGDSLHIVEQALRTNNIRFVSFDRNNKTHDVVEEFHRDTGIPVFLLHAERESAGLTLTSCGEVHLLEPLLRHSYELQAIGRVHRLGQSKPTKVYCYATMDTVEARILAQNVHNGTSIYLADEAEDAKTVAALPNVAHAASRGGDLATSDENRDQVRRLIFY